MSSIDIDAKERHWIKTRNLTYVILAFWALFAIVIPWMPVR